jgi:hypothetical protein
MDKDNILKGIAGCRAPVPLDIMQAKQFCPQAIIVPTRDFDMDTYIVHCDSLQHFLKQNIIKIYIDPKNSRKSNEFDMVGGAFTNLSQISVICLIKY